MALLAAGQALASAVLDPLLERAIAAVANEFRLIRGVHKEIEKLTLTLAGIKSRVADAEQRQLREVPVRDWLGELKQVLLDADDLLDEYATDAALQITCMGARRGNKVHAMLFLCFTCTSHTMTGRATAHQICEINRRLDHLRDLSNMFDLKLLPEGNNRCLQHTRRQQTSSMLARVTSVIGRDSEKEEIIELLLSSTHEPESSNNSSIFSVLPVVGMGGLGKTTLAQLVYNDERVEKHFQVKMWLCVSNDFDPTRLTKEMIDAASACKKGNNERQQVTHWDSMQTRLREEVEGRNVFLVLDDVWEVSRCEWERLLKPLKFANKGSKILVTTRISNAAHAIGGGRMHPVILRGLPDDDFWLLFKRRAFESYKAEEYSHLEEMGRHIANRLKGLPLAAKTIGGLMNTSLDVSHWRKIGKSEMLQPQQDEAGILPVLGLSYQYLSENLKQSFAYCSLFPKDHLFDKIELAQLWDAQCFSGTEDISSENFNNLLQRSFFEPSPKRKSEYVMHDLTHDLAEYVSKDDCFRLEEQRSMTVPDTVRHMSLLVTKFDQARLNELCRHKKLRTLLFLRKCVFDDSTHALDELFSKLKRLRVLGLGDCGIKVLPSSIGDPKHLRYIDLSHNDHLENLPESLCNLYNLQTLKLEGCGSLRALPIGMSKLINLRHLCLPYDHACGLFSRIHGLGSLTCLWELDVSGRKVGELGGMGMLRKLKIENLEEVMIREVAGQARLDSKEHLQQLSLSWGAEETRGAASVIDREVEEEVLQALRPVDSIEHLVIVGYKGAKSPTWMEDPTAWRSFSLLRSVELRNCPNWEVLPAFGQLRHLRDLHISDMPSVRRLGLRFFPSLEDLYIVDLAEWEEWGSGHPDPPPQQNPSSSSTFPSSLFFPRLRRLTIRGCPKLRELPPLPPTLEDLSIDGLPEWEEWRSGHPDPPPQQNPSSSSSSATSPGSSFFPRLRWLAIKSCPKLTELPPLPPQQNLTSLERLSISGCPAVTSLPAGAALQSLTVEDCEELASLGHFPALPSLEQLYITSCPKLNSLLQSPSSSSFSSSSSIEELYISNSSPQQINGWLLQSNLAFPFLHTLCIRKCPQLTSFGEDGGGKELEEALLHLAPSLLWLTFESCENLSSLPAQLSSLYSLETLDLIDCSEIQSLPEMGLPASLHYLYISSCPTLEERCRDQGGPERCKISSVPAVYIDGERIV